MTISGSSSASTPDIASDPQVRSIQAQIKDWTNCPTTPPQTKKVIVDRLQTKLDGVENQIKQHDATKQEQTVTSRPGSIDISV